MTVATLMVVVARPMAAAPVIFTSPAFLSGDTDVSTIGSFSYAYNWANQNTTNTVNGVAFTGTNNANAGGTNVTLTGFGTNNTTAFTGGTSTPWANLSTNYKSILVGSDSLTRNVSATSTVTLNALVSGHQYLTQFWVSDPRAGTTTTRTEVLSSTGGNSQTLSFNSNGAVGGVGQYSIGYFTASGTTQAFTVTGAQIPTVTSVSEQINAIQVRDVTNIGYWTGINGATWDNSTTANFATNLFSAALTTGTEAAAIAIVPNIYFADAYYNSNATTAVTQSSITIAAGGVSAPNVNFINNALNYTLAGADAIGITGSSAVYVEGTGTVNLTTANTYTGGTFVSAGTLQLSGTATLGAATAALTVSGGTLDLGGSTQTVGALNAVGGTLRNGTVVPSSVTGTNAGAAAISAAISGSARVTMNGSGTLTLSGANTYTGGTIVNSGVLQFNADANLPGSGGTPTPASVLITPAGTLAAGFAIDQPFINAINGASTGTVALAAASSNNLDFSASGANLPYVRFGAVGAQTYSGTLTPYGGNYLFGGSTGSNLTVSSALSGSNSLYKYGASTLTLTSAETLTGSVNLYQGITTLGSTGTLLNASGVALFGNPGESDASAAPLPVSNVPLAGPVLFINDGSGTTDHFGTTPVAMNGGSIQLSSSGSTTIQNLTINTSGQIVSAPSGGTGSAINITNLTLGLNATATFQSQLGSIGTGTTNVGQVYIANLSQNATPISLGGGTTMMLGPGLTVQTPSNQGGDGHTYFAAYGANGVTQLTGTVATVAAATAAPNGNLVDTGETVAGTSPFVVNSVVTLTGDLILPSASLLSVTSGGVIFGGNSHWIKAASGQTASITGGTFANNYTLYATVNNGGTDGGTDYQFNNVRITDNGGNPVTFVKGGSGLVKIGQSGTGGVGTATYTGPTIINSGTLQTSIGGALGTLTGTPTITVNAGGVLMGGANDSFGFTSNLEVITLNDGMITESAGNIRQTLWNTVTMNGGTITAPAGTGNNGFYSINQGINATSDAAGLPATINAQIGLQNGQNTGTVPFTVTRGPGPIDLLISSAITSFSAGEGLSINGTGVTLLTGNNIYTGVTNITGGTLRVGNAGTTGTLGTGAVTNNGALVFNRVDTLTVPNLISGGGTLSQAGAGTLVLTAANTYTGLTTISAGTLRLGDAATNNGNVGGDIVNNGALIFANPTSQVYTGAISGTGSLTKNATGTLTFTNLGTYTGPTAVNSGSLILTSSSGLANTAITVAGGASFSAHPGTGTMAIGSTATPSAGASLTLLAGTGASIGGAFDMLDGAIGTVSLQQGSGFGNGLILGGAGTSANAPSLAFEIGTSLGSIDTLAVSNGVSVGASGAKIAISGLPGATSLATGDYTFITASGGLGGAGFTLASTILNVGSHSYVLSLADSTANSEVLTISNSTIPPPRNAYWTGHQSGSWGTFTGVGTINTNWATDATGATDTQQLPGPETNVYFTINSGAQNLSNTLGLDFSINSLNFTGTGTSATSPVTISGTNTLTINAAAVNGNASGSGITVAAGAGAHTIATNVTLGASQTWANNSTNPLTVSGAVGDSGNAYALTIAGSGQISLSGNNSYSGGTFISSGALAINADAALGTVPANPQTNLTFTGNGTLRSSAAVTLNANRTILIGAGVTASFDSNGNTMAIPSEIDGGDATSALQKIGAGALNLSGSNTYSGGTIVTGGTLRAGAAGGTSVFGASGSSITVSGGGTLDYNGAPLNGSATPAVDYPVFASGSGVGGLGALVDNGPANDFSLRTLTLTGDTTVGGTARWGIRNSTAGLATLTGGGFSLTKVGASDFLFAQGGGTNPATTSVMTGVANININAGRLVVANSATVDNIAPGSIFVNTNGTLDVGDYNAGGAQTVSILKPIVMAGGSITTDAASNNGNATIDAPISLNATGLLAPQATSVLTLTGNITDGTASNGITVNAAGTVVLTGANSYSGPTTISAGTLQIGTGGTTGNVSAAAVIDNGALVFNRSDATLTIANDIGGTGSLTQTGPGTLVLPGNLTYTGGTTITAGAVTFANSTDQSYNGSITGAGAVNKTANGVKTLGGSSTYSGGTTIMSGTLAVRSNTALGTGTVTLSGGRLQLQLGTGGTPTGNSIGINFEGGQTAGTVGVTPLAATDSAGVVPQTNWNNVNSTNPVVVSATVAGGNSNIDGPTAGSIVDNHGNATAAAIQFLSTNPWAVSGTVPTGGDAKLMNGYQDNTAAATPTSVTLTSVPYAFYSVYAYVGSDGNGRVGHGQVNGGTSIYFSTNDNPFGGYVQATATTQAAAVASTYLQFDNLGGSSMTYTETRDTNNVGLHGLEIVEMTGSPISLANNLVVTADSTIDVTGFSSATVTGSLAIGANTLSVTGGSSGANIPYTLTLGATNLSGNATFNVANNGTGSGTLILGAVDDAGSGFGIAKTGNGTLAVTSVNGSTYSGPTNVNAGTLLVANSGGSAVGSGPVTVAGAGTLGVSATFGAGAISGAVSVNGGSITSASIGNQASASLTLGNGLSLAAGSKSSFALNGIGVNNTTNSNALVYVSGGTLAVAGATTVQISGSPAIGTYDLYGYVSGPTSISNFTTPAAPFGYAWSLAVSNNGSGIGASNASANQLDLVVTKVPLTWNGATNGAWDTTTQNWAMGLPGVATTYSDNNVVFFGDRDPVSGNLVTNTSVAIQAAGVTPASLNFTNTGAANGGVDYTVSGKLTLPAGASISKSGAGSATLTGPLSLGNNASLAVSAGILKFNMTSGASTIGTGVLATVTGSATLDLAGSVSALSSTSSPAARVNVSNNSSASAGLLVEGTNQQVGAIDGTGTTRVNAGSDLTANHIVQGALVIAGTSTSPATVTIAASDASGNSLVAATASSSGALIAGTTSPSSFVPSSAVSSVSLMDSNVGLSPPALGAANLGGASVGGAATVPEPSTLILISVGVVAGLFGGLRRR